MTVSNGDVVRVTARLRTAQGEDILNVFHYKADTLTDFPLETVIEKIAETLDDMYSSIQPAIPSDVSFIDIDGQNVSTGEVGPSVPWPARTVGGGTGDTMPEQLAGLCVGHTAMPHVVARKFLGPFIEADNADGTWASGLVAALADFATAWLTKPSISIGNEFIPGVARYVLGGLIDRFVPIGSTSSSNQIYTQRRRRRGVGI